MNIYTGAFVLVFALWNLGFLYAANRRRNDVADVLWGPSFLVAVLGGVLGETYAGRPVAFTATEFCIIGALTLWASRLGYYIGRRFQSHPAEDTRYAQWRKQWGATWLWRSYLQVFVLQPIILMVIAFTVLHALRIGPRPLTPVVIFGLLVFAFGFLFESVGDEQLRRFKADPSNKGKIMDRGLWAWSRHPNYFGEVTQWWGLYLMCFTLDSWWTIVSPLAITYMILKVSGVTMLEEMMRHRPGFIEYSQRTSVFIPLPPRNFNR